MKQTHNNQQEWRKRLLASSVLELGHAAPSLESFTVETQERPAKIVPSSQAVDPLEQRCCPTACARNKERLERQEMRQCQEMPAGSCGKNTSAQIQDLQDHCPHTTHQSTI